MMRTIAALILCNSALAAASQPPAPCDTQRWEGLITEAATRFEIPALWIRAILHTESAGCEHLNRAPTTSEAGAMGLMQLLPATWNEYRARLELGDNAYAPRDNILAGAAYLRDLYDHYGWPGAAAAYHAGPGRYEKAQTHAKPLPAVTLEYLARVERAMTQGPRTTIAKPSADPTKPNALFVELRREKAEARPHPAESSDVQPE